MSVGLKGNADGSGAIQVGGSDAITISTGLNTTFVGTASVSSGTLYPIVSATSVTASGASVDFINIPSWVKRITVSYTALQTSAAPPQVRIGVGSTPDTTGYTSTATALGGTAITGQSTVGYITNEATNWGSTAVASGNYVLMNIGSNTWVGSGAHARTDSARTAVSGGAKTLSSTLGVVSIAVASGTFSAGTVNIFYE